MNRRAVTERLNRTHAVLSRLDPEALFEGGSVEEIAELLIAASRVFAFQAALLRVADKRLSPDELIRVYQIIRDARAAAQAAVQLAGTPTEGRA